MPGTLIFRLQGKIFWPKICAIFWNLVQRPTLAAKIAPKNDQKIGAEIRHFLILDHLMCLPKMVVQSLCPADVLFSSTGHPGERIAARGEPLIRFIGGKDWHPAGLVLCPTTGSRLRRTMAGVPLGLASCNPWMVHSHPHGFLWRILVVFHGEDNHLEMNIYWLAIGKELRSTLSQLKIIDVPKFLSI